MNEYDTAYRQVSVLKALALFLFNSRRFDVYAARHDFGWLLATAADLRAAYENGGYTLESTDIMINVHRRSAVLRKTLIGTGLFMGTSALAGAAVGYLLAWATGPLAAWASSLMQAVAVAVILWATLWQLGRENQSFGGGTLAERIHGWIFTRCTRWDRYCSSSSTVGRRFDQCAP